MEPRKTRFGSIQLFLTLIAFLLAVVGSAHAAPAELPRTGQTTVYSTGDDGSLQTGVAWPSMRFTNSDGTQPVNGSVVVDQLTGLMWTRDGGIPTVGSCTGSSKTWQGALNYVACLNTNSYLGYTDWRLPNINELESLVHGGQADTATWLNAQGFTNALANYYWSSTTYVYDTANAWSIYMGNGNVYTPLKSITYSVWPVRAGQSGAPADLPRTGQTTSYSTSDDGSLQTGLAWPSPRFTNTDGTMPVSGDVVVDQLTGLMWTKDGGTPGPACSPGVQKTWQGALNYVACLNTNSYLGYTDWRLPNRKDMKSLVNYSQADTTSWLNNTQGFTNAQFNQWYWSSTTYAFGTGDAWSCALNTGHWVNFVKSSSLFVWPVRAGQSGSFAYLTISKSGAGSGTVSVDKGAIIWSGSTGTASYGSAMTVNLSAVADSGSTFAGWSGAGCSGTGACTVTMDAAKNVTASFDADITPPTGSISINSGAASTNSTSSTLTLSCTDSSGCSQMQFSNDNSSWSTPETYGTSQTWTLSSGDGTKTVYVRFKDTVGNWSTATISDTIVLDTTAPTGSISINSSAALTSSTYVTLTLSCTDTGGCSQMQFSNDNSSWSTPETYGTSQTWTLSSGDGTKTVYVRFKDTVGYWSTATISDTIVLDTANSTTTIAPADLPRTGQTTSYSTSDDGSLQTGVAWPSPRFTNTDGTQPVNGSVVVDQLTGLMWTRDGGTPTAGSCTGSSKTWQGALNYVVCLNTNNYLGYNDWRLPNINELESLVHGGQADTATWLNAQGFTNALTTIYWSSTTNATSTDGAWDLSMFYGFIGYSNKTGSDYVWPVRSGQSGAPAALPRTGQTTSYSTGDDGSLQTGVAWPSPRFTNTDGTPVSGDVVVDQLTGLMWTKDGGTPTVGSCTGSTKTWQGALDYVACLNTNAYLGYTDWRLPNRKDMKSLVNYSQTNTAPWLNTQGFTNAQANPYYWSSTTHAGGTGFAWWVGMIGDRDGGTKSVNYYVWPVRAGQSGSFAYLTISKSGTGSGTVSVDKGAIIWSGSTGTASYGSAMTVNLSAVADSGSTFAGWSGACSGTGACTVTMDAAKNVTASFDADTTPPTGTISINSSAASTNSTSATLTLSCTDTSGCSQMQFSNDNTNWSPAEAYATSKAWTLSSGDGTKTVYVKFKDTVGNWSTAFNDTITLDTPPSKPANIDVAQNGVKGELVVSWTNPSADFNHIHIYRSTASGTLGTLIADNLTGIKYTDTGLASLTTYFYTVRAVDNAGNESTNTNATANEYNYYPKATTLDSAPPAVPTNVTATDAGTGGKINLTWTNPTDTDLSMIKVYRSTTSGTLGTAVCIVLTSSCSDSGLTNGTTYYYTVRAVDTSSNETTNIDTTHYAVPSATDTTPPGISNTVTVTDTTAGGTLTVSWTWGGALDSDLAYLRIYRSTTSGQLGTRVYDNVLKTATSLTDSGLTNNAIYYYTVRSMDSSGNESTNTNQGSGTPTDLAPPMPVSNLTVTLLSSGVVKLDWIRSASLDVNYYNIYWDNGTGTIDYLNANKIGHVAHPLVTWTSSGSLAVGTAYKFAVRAEDAAQGEESNTNVVLHVVPVSDPATSGERAYIATPLTGQKIKNGSSSSVTVSAELLTGLKANVTGVQFQYKPASSGSWTNINSPVATYPWYTSWDVSAVANGDYLIRAVANSEANPSYITVTLDGTIFDTIEYLNGSEPVKEQAISTNAANTVTVSSTTSGPIEIKIPEGALTSDTTVTVVIEDPLTVTPLPPDYKVGDVFLDITLQNSQTTFENNKVVEIVVPYKDDNNNNYVDDTGSPGTVVYDLKIMWYNTTATAWEELDSTVDTTTKTVRAFTTHFSRFGSSAPPKKTTPGWNLVSVPLNPSPNDAMTVFGQTPYVWNPTAQGYERPSTIQPGIGYWIKGGSGGQSLIANGTETSKAGNFSITLKKGWNMIGNPFRFKVRISDMKVNYNSTEYTMAAAETNGTVVGTLYPYVNTVYPFVNASDDGKMDQWGGYWILSDKDCTLLIPPTPAQ